MYFLFLFTDMYHFLAFSSVKFYDIHYRHRVRMQRGWTLSCVSVQSSVSSVPANVCWSWTKFVGNIGADTKPTLVLELDEEDCSFEHNKLKVSSETEQAMYLVVFRQQLTVAIDLSYLKVKISDF